MTYKVVERLSPGLVGTESVRYGRTLWTHGKQRVERQWGQCQRLIRPGMLAWRPANQSAMNRHHRLCGACIPRVEDRCAMCGAQLTAPPRYFKNGQPICSQACAAAEWRDKTKEGGS